MVADSNPTLPTAQQPRTRYSPISVCDKEKGKPPHSHKSHSDLPWGRQLTHHRLINKSKCNSIGNQSNHRSQRT